MTRLRTLCFAIIALALAGAPALPGVLAALGDMPPCRNAIDCPCDQAAKDTCSAALGCAVQAPAMPGLEARIVAALQPRASYLRPSADDVPPSYLLGPPTPPPLA